MTNYERRFSLMTKEQQYSLIGFVILDKMLNKKRSFNAMLEGDDTHLEPVMEFLLNNGILDLEDSEYIPTPKGKTLYKHFLDRYKEYLKVYDVFCAVDLEAGLFGFSKIFDYNEDVFQNYINQDRFVDLRVTVLEFKNRISKNLDPQEVVFISFFTEKRFREPKDRTIVLGEESWQYATVYGEIFEEIRDICNKSLHFEELAYEDEEGEVPGEDVISDIIEQGVELAAKIHQWQAELEADERAARRAMNEENETVETVVYEHFDYGPYYDPWYISPVWDVALIGLILL
jgi:hypothetical protein